MRKTAAKRLRKFAAAQGKDKHWRKYLKRLWNATPRPERHKAALGLV